MNTSPCESVIEEVTRVRDLASQLQILLRHNSPRGADELSEGLLQSLTAALSVLNPNQDHLFSFRCPAVTKPSSSSSSSSYTMKREEKERNCMGSQSQSSRNSISSGNSCSRRIKLTTSPYYDGREWRKYGQKNIRGTHFPRCYYKCTYADKQDCPATKTVEQKNSNDPPLFEVSYAKQHTCKSLFIAPQLQLDEGTTEVRPEQFSLSFPPTEHQPTTNGQGHNEQFSFSSCSFPPTEHESTFNGQGHNGYPDLGQNTTPFSSSACTIAPDSTSPEILDSDLELLRALLAPAPDFNLSCL